MHRDGALLNVQHRHISAWCRADNGRRCHSGAWLDARHPKSKREAGDRNSRDRVRLKVQLMVMSCNRRKNTTSRRIVAVRCVQKIKLCHTNGKISVCGKGKRCFIKGNMPRNNDAIGRMVEASVTFMSSRVSQKHIKMSVEKAYVGLWQRDLDSTDIQKPGGECRWDECHGEQSMEWRNSMF